MSDKSKSSIRFQIDKLLNELTVVANEQGQDLAKAEIKVGMLIADLKAEVREYKQREISVEKMYTDISNMARTIDRITGDNYSLEKKLYAEKERSGQLLETLKKAMLLLKRYALCDENFDECKSIEKEIAEGEKYE